ncbi:MAG TPA: NUDIX domain-containing protein [Candidatus Binatia bacterium]|nr:NUDIX domain-containing protein [Candidatus Binatia bacterium]
MSQAEPSLRFYGKQGHPWVAVDVVIYTLDEGALQCLLVQVKDGPFAGQWAFPGGLVGAEESLDQAAEREVYERIGIKNCYLEQVYTFGKPERDPATRVVSVSYLALLPYVKMQIHPAAKYGDIRWYAADRLPPLAYDHDQVARIALQRLRSKLQYTNIVYSLLPSEFTLGELQEVYETILDRRLDRRNFRKKILALGLLKQLPKKRRGTHRPAALYAFIKRRPMIIEMV